MARNYPDRRDENEPDIIEHIKTLRPLCVPQPIQAPAIGDLLVQFRLDGDSDPLMFCGTLEVKNPQPGHKPQLTEAQAVYAPSARRLGILYEIVTTPEEAEAAIRKWRKAIGDFFAHRTPKKRKARR